MFSKPPIPKKKPLPVISAKKAGPLLRRSRGMEARKSIHPFPSKKYLPPSFFMAADINLIKNSTVKNRSKPRLVKIRTLRIPQFQPARTA